MKKNKKIGVLRANAIGDLIVTLPALHSLKASFPDSEIVLLGRKNHWEILNGRDFSVDRFIQIPSSIQFDQAFDHTLPEHSVLIDQLVDEGFDLFFQLHGGGRNSNRFVNLIRPKFSVGAKTFDAEELHLNIPYTQYQHEIFRMLDIIKAGGGKEFTTKPQLFFQTSDFEIGERILEEEKLDVVLINPGAKDPKRRWPIEKFLSIAKELVSQGKKVVINCGPDESNLAQFITKGCPEAIFLPLSINELIGVLSKTSLVISNDTGTMHLAMAFGIPTIALFWHRNLISYGPVSSQKTKLIISWENTCPRCSCNCLMDYCSHEETLLDSIGVEEVKEAIKELFLQMKTPYEFVTKEFVMKEVSELIRGEMSAVKSIDTVLGKIRDTKDIETLRSLREDHVRAIDKLKRYAGSDFRENEEVRSSGPWGNFTSAFAGGASFFGDKVAIKALKLGEEHGCNEYRELLKNSSISPEVRQVVENELLPQQERHLSTISKYLQ